MRAENVTQCLGLKAPTLNSAVWLKLSNSGFGAESPNAALSSNAVIIERTQKEKRIKNYLSGFGDEIPNAPISSETEMIEKKEKHKLSSGVGDESPNGSAQ